MSRRAPSKRRALLLAVLLSGAATPASAQQALGVLATTCGPLDANRSLPVDTTAAVPARAVVVASVVGNGVVLDDLVLVDPASASYTAIGARRTRATAKLGVAQLFAPVVSAVPAGSRFTLRAVAAPPGTSVCVSLAAFTDVAVGAAAMQSRAAAGGNNATPALTGDRNGDGTPQVLLGSFAFAADPSGFATAQPGIVATSACDAAQTLCIGALAGNDAGGGALALGATLGTAVNWSGVLASLDRDSMFKDGFE